MKLTVEFGGGIEHFVQGNKKTLTVEYEEDVLTCKEIIKRIATDCIMNNNKNMFVSSRPDSDGVMYEYIKPGILVLINDTDWDVLGANDATVYDGNTISFISTLHGG